jgi:hypothetical protein
MKAIKGLTAAIEGGIPLFPTHPSRQSYKDKAITISGKPHQFLRGKTLYNVIDYKDQNNVYLGTQLISKSAG